MILYALTVQVPADVVRYLMHNRWHVPAAGAHMLAALHADTVDSGSAPRVAAVMVLRHHRARNPVVVARKLN